MRPYGCAPAPGDRSRVARRHSTRAKADRARARCRPTGPCEAGSSSSTAVPRKKTGRHDAYGEVSWWASANPSN